MNKNISAVLRLKDQFSTPLKKCASECERFNKKADYSDKAVTRLHNNLKNNLVSGFKRVGVAAAAATVTIAATGIKLGKTAASYSAQVAKNSAAMGVSTTKYQEMNYAMVQAGTSMTKVRVGAKTLLKQMSAADSGNAKSAKAFKTLGVSIKDSSGKMRSQQSVMIDTISAFQKMKNGSEKSALAMQLFGRSGQEMSALLNQMPGTFQKNMQEAKKLGLVLGADGVKAGVKLQHSMSTLKLSMQMVGVEVGAMVIPYMQKFTNFILAHMPQISKVATGVGKVFKVLGNIMDAALNHPKITGIIAAGIGIAVVAVKVHKAIKAFKEIKTAIKATSLISKVGSIKFLLIVAAIAAVSAVIIICVKHWKQIRTWVKKAAKAFINFVDPCGVLRAALSGIVDIILAIISAIKTAIGWFKELFNNADKASGLDTKTGTITTHVGGGTTTYHKPKHALGSQYFGGGLTGFSENGRAESAVLPSGSKIIPADKTKKDLKEQQPVSVNVIIKGNVVGNKKFADEVGNIVGHKVLAALANV